MVCYSIWLNHAELDCLAVRATDNRAISRYQDEIQPILIDYCYRCHADGMKKGDVALDEFASDGR